MGHKTVKSKAATLPDNVIEPNSTSECHKTLGCEQWTGTVILSAPNHQWTVFWVQIGHCSTHSYNVLRYESSSRKNYIVNLSKSSINAILLEKKLVNQAGIDSYLTL